MLVAANVCFPSLLVNPTLHEKSGNTGQYKELYFIFHNKQHWHAFGILHHKSTGEGCMVWPDQTNLLVAMKRDPFCGSRERLTRYNFLLPVSESMLPCSLVDLVLDKQYKSKTRKKTHMYAEACKKARINDVPVSKQN